MRISKTLGILALLALFATSALALSGSGGGGGLAAVTTNSSLTGNGTGGSPLGVASSGASYCTPNYSGGANISFVSGAANAVDIWPASIALTYPLTWSHICVNVGTLDASGFYDVAVAPAGSGTTSILAETGAKHYPVTGVVCTTILQNAACTGAGAPGALCTGVGTGTNPVTVTSNPGNYRLITTGNANIALLQGNAAGVNFMMPDAGNTSTTSTNGVGPATFTAPVPAPQITTLGFLQVCLY